MAVKEAVTLFLENTANICLNDFMFKSISNNSKNRDQPMSARAINMLLEKLADELNINIHMSSHTLRKTFCYHQMVMSNNDHRKLLLLQKMLNHSTAAQTLDYIGITEEEIERAYKELNLGGRNNYLVNSEILEVKERIG